MTRRGDVVVGGLIDWAPDTRDWRRVGARGARQEYKKAARAGAKSDWSVCLPGYCPAVLTTMVRRTHILMRAPRLVVTAQPRSSWSGRVWSFANPRSSSTVSLLGRAADVA
eukprot:scaffold704_cov347-Prasinococcus_capsulatus_cf.AAC.15